MTLLRELIDIPEQLSTRDFVTVLAEQLGDKRTLDDYVVTEQLEKAFDQALGVVRAAVQSSKSQAAFIHGSFGSGKSHFMAVLHALLGHDADARMIPELSTVIGKHDQWLSGRKVLRLNFHMVGAESLEERIFSEYIKQIRTLHPTAELPSVHHSDSLLSDARALRSKLGDEAFFAGLPNIPAWGKIGKPWTAASFDQAAAGAPDDPSRARLVDALVKSYFTSFVQGGSYRSIDEGLQAISAHAKNLGYDVVVLFLDELVLWLANKVADPAFVSSEAAKVAKLVESAEQHRPVPLVSFVARQRDLKDFLGDHVPGAQQVAFSETFRWFEDRFDPVKLEDRNLPAIAEKRLLRPKPEKAEEAARVFRAAFDGIPKRPDVWDVLLTGTQQDGSTAGDDEKSFRQTYPFSPALVAALVALSQILQRERTALKIMLQILIDQRDELTVTDLVPVGDIFDVVVDTPIESVFGPLQKHVEEARKLYQQRLRPALLRQHGLTEDTAVGLARTHPFRVDDRLVKTLLLSALVPDTPVLRNLDAGKLAALNHGTIISPLPGEERSIVLDKIRKLAASGIGEIRVGDGDNPSISVVLTNVDYESVLENARTADAANYGARRQLVRKLVWRELGLEVNESLYGNQSMTYLWRGRRNVVDLVFGNVRDRSELPESTLLAEGDRWKVVIDFPFDENTRGVSDDFSRITDMRNTGVSSQTVCWLPSFLTADRMRDLGRLVVLDHVLSSNDRFNAASSHLSPQDRMQAKILLESQQSTLRQGILGVLKQAYGAAARTEADIDVEHASSDVFTTLDPGFQPNPSAGADIKSVFTAVLDKAFKHTWPGHPDFGSEVKIGELKKALEYVTKAVAESNSAAAVEVSDRPTLRRICNQLRVGEMLENKLLVDTTTMWWSTHFRKLAAAEGCKPGVYPVELLRKGLDTPEPRGLDRLVANFVIMAFAAKEDLVWYQHGGPVRVVGLDRDISDMELRESVRPEVEDWTQARTKAAKLLGITVAPQLSTKNVTQLATEVKEAAQRYIGDSRELAQLLRDRAGLLGLDTASARLRTAEAVQKLLDELVTAPDDNARIRMLALVELPSTEEVVGTAISSAPSLRRALVDVRWQLLSSLEVLIDANDHRAVKATDVLTRLREVAAREERHEKLAPALETAQLEATDLLTEAAPVVPPIGPTPPILPTKPIGGPRLPERGERTVSSDEEITVLLDGIRSISAEGKQVRVHWEVLE
nr:DUF6079 family protein [Kibdelosporangium sp. MJ126-NF4]CEL19291.1 Bacteriophage (PhiC31) resistance gene pglY [Kibdelosporangium sp. MJ126-NF4]CTQ94910.1 Bacteriophage (PhiC31) resistance gene pglY [Kibdelosporangium sp. MJ126-NF4]